MFKAKCIKDVKWGNTDHVIIHKGTILEYEYDIHSEKYPYIIKLPYENVLRSRLTLEGWREHFKIVLVIPDFIQKEEMQI